MLHLYIDKVFLWELARRTDKDEEVVHDFIHYFLKKVRGVRVTLNCTVEELRRLSESDAYFAWLPEINPSLTLTPGWEEDIEGYSRQEGISKLFLLANSACCTEWEQRFGYLYLNNNNLAEKWAPVRINRDEDTVSANRVPDKRYWEQLTDMVHPFNSLLVFDKYALSNKANQRLEHNLLPFLRYFLNQFSCSKNLKGMVVFSHEMLENQKQLTNGERVQQAQAVLQEAFSPEATVEVIKYDNTHVKIKAAQKEHDRFLVTNYMCLEAGSGFCIYDEHGKPSSHLKLTIRSIFKNSHRNIIEESLKNLSAYTATLKEEVTVLPPLWAGAPPRTVRYQPFSPSRENVLIRYTGEKIHSPKHSKAELVH